VEGLRRAGCRIVWGGAESGAQHVLDAMDKGTTVEQIYTAAKKLHAAGIQIAFFLQFGYPGETRADIEKTIKMVRDCNPDDIGISVSYPLPGTKFHEQVRRQMGEKQNWVDSNDLEMMFQGAYTTEFYRVLHQVIHHEFRMRKAAGRMGRALVRPWTLRPSHLRDALSLPRHWAGLQSRRRELNALEKVKRSEITPLQPAG